MKIALVLHAHQPPTQFPEITKKIIQNCYRPLFDILEGSTDGQITLNLTRSWGECVLEAGDSDLLKKISSLYQGNKISIMQTAAYHPLLTKIPSIEIERQVSLHQVFMKEQLDIDVTDSWMFLPEMSFNKEILEPLAAVGVTKVLLDESAFPAAGIADEGKHMMLNLGNHLYEDIEINAQYLFRDRPLSLALAFGQIKTIDDFIKATSRHRPQEEYAVLALDAETFGHHHEDNLALVANLLEDNSAELVSLESINISSLERAKVDPLTSTWGAGSESEGGRQFPRWDNPNNPLHYLQWILFRVAIRKCKHLTLNSDMYDKALNSDQFWWSSANPCWHPMMVDRSTNLLYQAIKQQGEISTEEDEELKSLRDKIILLGKELYDGQVIEC